MYMLLSISFHWEESVKPAGFLSRKITECCDFFFFLIEANGRYVNT